jgi:hypothetical protein
MPPDRIVLDGTELPVQILVHTSQRLFAAQLGLSRPLRARRRRNAFGHFT